MRLWQHIEDIYSDIYIYIYIYNKFFSARIQPEENRWKLIYFSFLFYYLPRKRNFIEKFISFLMKI